MALVRKINTWYWYKRVPQDVQERLGKKKFVVSLRTDQKHVAKVRALQVEQDLLTEIEHARRPDEKLEADIKMFRRELKRHPRGSDAENDAEHAYSSWLDHQDNPEDIHERVQQTPLVELLETYNRFQPVGKSATYERANALKLLSEKMQVEYVEEVNKAVAIEFSEALLEDGMRSRSTIRKIQGKLSSFWGWMVDNEFALSNPFNRVLIKAEPTKRRGFNDLELLAVSRQLEGTSRDAFLVLCATGLRLKELFLLESVESVQGFSVAVVKDAKTTAGNRTVPLPTNTQQRLERFLRTPPTLRTFQRQVHDAIEACNLDTKELSVHSARKWWFQTATQLDFESRIIDFLGGHSSGQLARTYGKTPSLLQCMLVVDKVQGWLEEIK